MPCAEKYQGKAAQGLVCGACRLLMPLWFCDSLFVSVVSFAVASMPHLSALPPSPSASFFPAGFALQTCWQTPMVLRLFHISENTQIRTHPLIPLVSKFLKQL